MTKPLLYYCGAACDEKVFRLLEERLDNAPKERKLRIAAAALNLYSQPFNNYIFTSEEHEDYKLIEKLSSQGQLELVIALVMQARQP